MRGSKEEKTMNKLAKRLVIFAAAMVMMLASSLTVFAKENEAVPRIVDNVMYVDEGSNNVWVYGVAISIAGGNKTDIVPNNPSKKIDVMANGQLFKQLDGVVLLKDEKKDKVFLEAGSTVIEAPSITDKALVTLKKAIADGKADSITAAQVLGTTADKGALAYQIAENGKVLTASGEDMATLLKTNANYKSVLNAFEEAVKAAEEAAKEAADASGPAVKPSGCSGPEYLFVVSADNSYTKLPIIVKVNDTVKYNGDLAKSNSKKKTIKVNPDDDIEVIVYESPEINKVGNMDYRASANIEIDSDNYYLEDIDFEDEGSYVVLTGEVSPDSYYTYVDFWVNEAN